ncbi:response regulator transcription factor [Sorangium sp. So ce1151]|uniref:helix-turn-helix transcriptional regulator n=1 Tax=Sorangium sp. So ce1151 TaxID=3133332 RepID=UPI003F607B1F
MGASVIRTTRVRELLSIVGEAHELAARPTERRLHVLRRLAGLVHARTAVVCSLADPPPRGPGRISEAVGVGWACEKEERAVHGILAAKGLSFDPLASVLFTRHHAASGSVTSVCRRDSLSLHEWYDSEYFSKVRSPYHVDDGLYSLSGGGPQDPLVALSFHRAQDDGWFSEEDLSLIDLAQQVCAQVLSAPTTQKRLSRRAQQTLDGLMLGRSEKEIAAELGLSPHTIHEYVTSIYRSFGVRSRGELLAKCLRA